MKYDTIELLAGAEIINFKPESVDTLPDFSVDDRFRFVGLTTDGQVYFNNGTQYVPFEVATTTSSPLIATLGNNWINNDYTFNPTPFNNLDNISGLTSTDSLFNVIQQLDAALTAASVIALNDINQISVDDLAAGQILYFDGTNFVNVLLSEIPDFSLSISLDTLTDVTITGTPDDNQILVFDSSADKFVNKRWAFRYEQDTLQTTHVVTHGLGQKYCSVTVIDPDTDDSITPTSIHYDSDTQLTVNLSVAHKAIILITTIPIQS